MPEIGNTGVEVPTESYNLQLTKRQCHQDECQTCPHGPYVYAIGWDENGTRFDRSLGNWKEIEDPELATELAKLAEDTYVENPSEDVKVHECRNCSKMFETKTGFRAHWCVEHGDLLYKEPRSYRAELLDETPEIVQAPIGNEIPVREVWSDEEDDFSPWVAENIHEFVSVDGAIDTEVPLSDGLQCDVLAEGDEVVVVENQLTTSDHEHLGKLLTYISQTDADIAVWIAPTVQERHRRVLADLERDLAGVDVMAFEVTVFQRENSIGARINQVV